LNFGLLTGAAEDWAFRLAKPPRKAAPVASVEETKVRRFMGKWGAASLVLRGVESKPASPDRQF